MKTLHLARRFFNERMAKRIIISCIIILFLQVIIDSGVINEEIKKRTNQNSPNITSRTSIQKVLAATSSGSVTGASGSIGPLQLVLRAKENNTYIMNTATAQATGGGGGTSSNGPAPGVPAGAPDGSCTPTGQPLSETEIEDKYSIALEDYTQTGIKMISELLTCVSNSKLPSLIEATVIENGISQSLGGIGMNGCSPRPCRVYIPEDTNAFKFILTHELGHVAQNNLHEATHFTEFRNAFDTEGAISSYSRSCAGSPGISEDFAETFAYFLHPNTRAATGKCNADEADDPNPLTETNKYPLHVEVAKKILLL